MRIGWIVALVVAAVLVLSGCGGSSGKADTASNEAVSVHLLSLTSNDALALEKRLTAKIADKAVGAYDETRWFATDNGGEAQLLAYGPDADALWDAMRPVVHGSDPEPGSYVIKTYGDPLDPSAKQVRVNLPQ